MQRLMSHYSLSLFRPLVYDSKVFKPQARFYFFKERLKRGETIHFSSVNESEEENESSASVPVSTDNILKKIQNQSKISSSSFLMDQSEIKYPTPRLLSNKSKVLNSNIPSKAFKKKIEPSKNILEQISNVDHQFSLNNELENNENVSKPTFKKYYNDFKELGGDWDYSSLDPFRSTFLFEMEKSRYGHDTPNSYRLTTSNKMLSDKKNKLIIDTSIDPKTKFKVPNMKISSFKNFKEFSKDEITIKPVQVKPPLKGNNEIAAIKNKIEEEPIIKSKVGNIRVNKVALSSEFQKSYSRDKVGITACGTIFQTKSNSRRESMDSKKPMNLNPRLKMDLLKCSSQSLQRSSTNTKKGVQLRSQERNFDSLRKSKYEKLKKSNSQRVYQPSSVFENLRKNFKIFGTQICENRPLMRQSTLSKQTSFDKRKSEEKKAFFDQMKKKLMISQQLLPVKLTVDLKKILKNESSQLDKMKVRKLQDSLRSRLSNNIVPNKGTKNDNFKNEPEVNESVKKPIKVSKNSSKQNQDLSVSKISLVVKKNSLQKQIRNNSKKTKLTSNDTIKLREALCTQREQTNQNPKFPLQIVKPLSLGKKVKKYS